MADFLDDLLIIVPARGGSERVPDKNLKPLAGRGLLQRVQDTIDASGLDVPVLLSTDSEDIARHGRELGWNVPFMRPPALAAADTPTEAAMSHALDYWCQAHGEPALTMLLQPTSPLRQGRHLATAVDMMRRPEVNAVLGVHPLKVSAKHLYVRNGADALHPALPVNLHDEAVFVPNGAMYLVRTADYRWDATLTPRGTHPLVMSTIESIDVDTPFDWRLAEFCLGTDMDGPIA